MAVVGEASVLKTSEMLESVSPVRKRNCRAGTEARYYAYVAIFRKGSSLGTELLEK